MGLEPGDVDAGLTGDFVALSVADTGQGTPPDIQAKVFDPFFTTKGSGKGQRLKSCALRQKPWIQTDIPRLGQRTDQPLRVEVVDSHMEA